MDDTAILRMMSPDFHYQTKKQRPRGQVITNAFTCCGSKKNDINVNKEKHDDSRIMRNRHGSLLKSLSSTSSQGSTKSKNVSFKCIEIREFPIELGDNPAVHEGPPIQIGWTPQKIDVLELDVYEVFRHRRRERNALALSTDERIDRLLSLGYTQEEITAAMTDVAKVRHERCISADRSKDDFTTSSSCSPCTSSSSPLDDNSITGDTTPATSGAPGCGDTNNPCSSLSLISSINKLQKKQLVEEKFSPLGNTAGDPNSHGMRTTTRRQEKMGRKNREGKEYQLLQRPNKAAE